MFETLQIVNGPDRWEMALAVFESGKRVEFSLKGGDQLLRRAIVSVTEVDFHPDPSEKQEMTILGQSDSAALAAQATKNVSFEARYNFVSRQGTLRITDTT